MQGCFKQVISAHRCEWSYLTCLPDRHNMLRSAFCVLHPHISYDAGSWECMSSKWAARNKAAMHAGYSSEIVSGAAGVMTDLVSPCNYCPESKQPQR